MNKLLFLAAIGVLGYFLFGQSDKMPSAQLQVHNEDTYSEMDGSVGGRCMQEKCLTVYVAPWCPACKSLRPTIIDMAKQFKDEGVDVTIIVGQDKLKTTQKYAESFPFPVLLDPDGNFFHKAKQRGVPFFLVSNREGEIVSELAGGTTHIQTMRNKLKL